MIERIVENWLTKAGERGFQTAFAQLLMIEGHRLLHNPVHHPFEHGKDLSSVGPEQRLWSFQLKGGDIGLDDLNEMYGQLMALAQGAVMHPSINPPRRPDRVQLVTTGEMSPPARDRLANINLGNMGTGIPAIEAVERPALVSRFTEAHGKYLPREPRDLNTLLKFYLGEGRGPFPRQDLAEFLSATFSPSGRAGGAAEAARSLASGVLLTAYASSAWDTVENHAAVAEAWMTAASQILLKACVDDLDEEAWEESFDLAFSSMRQSLDLLGSEAAGSKDLLIPDLVEGAVYPTRALVVCGLISLSLLIERAFGELEASRSSSLVEVVLRELPYIRVQGESAAPYILTIGSALEAMGRVAEGRNFVGRYTAALAYSQADPEGALPDPYHSLEDCLLRVMGADVDLPDEQFHGSAYTLHVCIEWLARRGERKLVEQIWPPFTRLTICEFQPSAPARYLSGEDDAGSLNMRVPESTQSWAELQKKARNLREDALPAQLWRKAEFATCVPLVFPQRETPIVRRAVDWLVSPGSVDLSMAEEERKI